jgi:PAS domain S-box-containing protein
LSFSPRRFLLGVGGTRASARRLVRLLVVPVLVLLVVLSLLQFQQRLADAKRGLLRQADARAQELDTLARPAVHHVHDLKRLLELNWDQPPDNGPLLANALTPHRIAGAIDGWSLDAAPEVLRAQLGQLWWATPERMPPQTTWLRRAQSFVQVARVAQERMPGFESAWFVAGDLNVSFGYPWVSTPQMLQSMGLPTLRALEPLRRAGVYRALARRASGMVAHPVWGEPYISQLNGRLVQSHATQIWRHDVYLGEVSVDVRLDAMQERARQWRTEGSRVWVVSLGGMVLADSGAPLPEPVRPGFGDSPVHVSLSTRLPEGVTPQDLAALERRAGTDGAAVLHEAGGWALVSAQRSGSPWLYLEATPLRQLHLALLPTLLPNAVLALSLLVVFVVGQWLISRWFVTPALGVLAYMRQLSEDPNTPVPELGPRWRGWVEAVTHTFARQRALLQRERGHEAFKSAMVDNAPMAIITQDEHGRVVEFNPAAEKLLGLDRAQAVGRHLPERLLPKSLVLSAGKGRAAGKAVHAGAADAVLDIVGQRADGTPFPAQVQRFALPQDAGVFQIAFITDLSARVAAARQIEDQREALRQSEKLNAMGSLLAGVAHELNNPLSVVMGRASLLQDKLESLAVAEDALEDARRVHLAAERCGRIVRTFLNMARRKPAQRRWVQLADVVHGAVDIMAYTLRGHGIGVNLQLAEDLPQVLADPDQLGQVVLNLMVNAQQALLSQPHHAHAPQEGGAAVITLSSGLEEPRPGQPAQVWLRVADNGPGVPDAVRQHLFQPFFTTKGEGLGTGLGLSISTHILREHGGSLVLEDADHGACFRLGLPLNGPADDDHPTPTACEAAQAHEAGASGRVLVVDDEPDIADLMRAVLEDAGLEVATAESGAVALEMLHEARFDVVISDLRMPDIDGPALWQAITDIDPALARRTLFVSGDMLSDTSQQWLHAQGLPSLDKPFANDELLVAVRRLMVT